MLEGRAKSFRLELEGERKKSEGLEKKLKWCEERGVRLEGEGESLRGEIRCVLLCLLVGIVC